MSQMPIFVVEPTFKLDVKMGQLNYDERVMVTYLRNQAKDGSTDIPQDQLDQFHKIYKDWEKFQAFADSPPQLALAIRDKDTST